MTTEKYVIITPTDWSGMCGYIWQILRTIHSLPDKKYYIDLTNYISNGDETNVWDKFFHQPHIDHRPSGDEIEFLTRTINTKENEFIHELIEPNTPSVIQERRREYYEIIQKYMVLQSDIKEKIESFYNENFKDNKVLGVHFRGTDHPNRNKENIDKYLDIIEKHVDQYDKIFVCSDELDMCSRIRDRFGDKVVFYGALRSTSNVPLHMPFHRGGRINDAEYQCRIAEDVIIESHLLSMSDFLICSTGSNVNFLSRALNPELESLTLMFEV